MAGKVSYRHQCVALLWLSGLSQRQAMLEAGYAKGVAEKRTDLIFSRPDVKEFINEQQKEILAKLDVSKEWVTGRLVAIAQAGEVLAKFKKVDPKTGMIEWDFRGATEGELALIDTLTVDTTYGLSGKTVKCKIGVPSQLSALDSLCRIMGFNKDPLADALKMNLVERLQQGRKRAAAKE